MSNHRTVEEILGAGLIVTVVEPDGETIVEVRYKLRKTAAMIRLLLSAPLLRSACDPIGSKLRSTDIGDVMCEVTLSIPC